MTAGSFLTLLIRVVLVGIFLYTAYAYFTADIKDKSFLQHLGKSENLKFIFVNKEGYLVDRMDGGLHAKLKEYDKRNLLDHDARPMGYNDADVIITALETWAEAPDIVDGKELLSDLTDEIKKTDESQRYTAHKVEIYYFDQNLSPNKVFIFLNSTTITTPCTIDDIAKVILEVLKPEKRAIVENFNKGCPA